MTEKRYKLSEPNGLYLVDNDRPYAHWINDDDKIIDLLNDLVDENERLKQQFSEQRTQIDVLKNQNIQLEVMISFILILFIIFFVNMGY